MKTKTPKTLLSLAFLQSIQIGGQMIEKIEALGCYMQNIINTFICQYKNNKKITFSLSFCHVLTASYRHIYRIFTEKNKGERIYFINIRSIFLYG